MLFINERMYEHKVFRVNYTSYDLRRGQDSINVEKHPDVMVLLREWDATQHPFSYARVLGIFHIELSFEADDDVSSVAQHYMEFLWVRWYELDTTYGGGFKHRRMYRIQPTAPSSDHAYGFLDPADVIRGAHFIPASSHQHSDRPGENYDAAYYVNMQGILTQFF
jgi:hypothetical protein